MRIYTRYHWLWYVIAVLAVVMPFLASWLLKGFELSVPLRLLVALLPIPPFLILMLTYIQWIRQLDELQQRIHLEALAITFPTVIIIGLTLQYLETAGFLPAWDFSDAWPYMALLYLVVWMVVKRRYG
jgi:hypothetical protein